MENSFFIVKEYGYSQTELDNMIPYEYDLTTAFILSDIHEQEKRLEKKLQAQKAARK